MEFTKAENKIAKVIIEIALQRELAKELEEFSAILEKWKCQNQIDHRNSYYELFNSVKDFDKHLANRYDGLKNSIFQGTLIGLLADKVIDKTDLMDFSEVRRNQLLAWAKRRNQTSK